MANTRAPNIVIARAAPLSRLARYIILPQYHPSAATRSSGTPHTQVLAFLKPSSVLRQYPTQQTIIASPLPKTDLLRRSGGLVVFAQHFVRPPQISGGSIHVAVVRLEIRLGGGGGVGRQMVSQLVGIAEFVDRVNEHFVLVLMFRGRREVPGSASIVLEGNVVSLQFLDILSGESIVTQQLVVAPQGGLHRVVLYVSDLIKVRSFARAIGSCLLGDVLRPTALLGVGFFGPLGLCPFGLTFIRTQRKGGHHSHARRHG